MKHLLALISALCCVQLAAFSQTDWYYFPDEIYFVKEVSAKDLRGKEFRYQIAVKAAATDTFSKVRINGVAAGKGREDFLNNSNFSKQQSTESEWTIYTISGTIPQEAWKLWFYSAVNGNGEFYFDDVQFYIKEGNDWVQLELSNPSFEEDHKNIFKGYYVNNRQTPHLKTAISKTVSHHGEHSLHVTTHGLRPTVPRSLTKQ
ncbi:MAG TPA: hypothetical protein VD993_14895 [Chitinophagaceae bacterium]|nr:hypothetical protein [Chitinophagaceae bacterium]